jgi:hemolysin activation/secretion protein
MLASEAAFAQGAELVEQLEGALIEGPEATRPELLPVEPEILEELAPRRTLPRIEIPTDNSAGSALAGREITVNSFRFTGNTVFSDEELESVTEPFIGEGRRYSALLEARDRVSRAYIDAGYISSGAVLADQKFLEGVVEITIVEGKLTTIEITSDGRLRDHYISSRLRATRGTLNINALSESLRRLKRDPRIKSVAAELVPGLNPDESVLSIAVDESVPYWSRASFSNHTAEAIGGFLGRVRAGHQNVTGWGDSWSAAYSGAEGLNDLDFRVQVPITRFDTSFELKVRQAWSEIVEDATVKAFAPKLTSRSESYGLRIRQPILRARGREAGLFFAGDWKRSRSKVGPFKKFISEDPVVFALRFGGDYLLRMRQRAIAARATVSVGVDALDAKASTGDEPGGKFTSALIQVQAVEYLPWNDMRLQTRVDVQLADRELLGLERFALGGHGSVRGYRENLAVRDMGIVTSAELRIPLPLVKPVERLEFAIFTDAGVGRYLNSRDPQDAVLVSVGVGLHADITDYFRVSFEWAQDLTESNAVTGKELQDDGLHFTLQARFP